MRCGSASVEGGGCSGHGIASSLYSERREYFFSKRGNATVHRAGGRYEVEDGGGEQRHGMDSLSTEIFSARRTIGVELKLGVEAMSRNAYLNSPLAVALITYDGARKFTSTKI